MRREAHSDLRAGRGGAPYGSVRSVFANLPLWDISLCPPSCHSQHVLRHTHQQGSGAGCAEVTSLSPGKPAISHPLPAGYVAIFYRHSSYKPHLARAFPSNPTQSLRNHRPDLRSVRRHEGSGPFNSVKVTEDTHSASPPPPHQDSKVKGVTLAPPAP